MSKTHNGIRIVLSKPYMIGTHMLWTAYFMGLVIFYSMINWMPVLFKDAGLSQGTAAVITALFPLGGVWAILSGWLMDRFSANLTVAICFALTALGVWSIGQTGSHVALLASLVLIAGVLLNTAQTSLPSLAAAFYPTQGRATWRLDASAALPALFLSLNWHVETSRLDRSSREWQFPGSSPGERCW